MRRCGNGVGRVEDRIESAGANKMSGVVISAVLCWSITGSLSSCQARMFGNTEKVPWQMSRSMATPLEPH